MLNRRVAIAALLVLGTILSATGPASAETNEVRIAQQFGISYLPLIVMKEQHLLEQAVVEAGLARPTVTWAQFSGAAAMNDALISGNLDVATAGVGPMIIVWARTHASLKITGVAALGAMPNLLTTSNPRIKTLADFTDKDRIALPAVKIGAQAVMLQMAAEQAFGAGQQNKLDDITVSMAHPDAAAALLGGASEIDAHFTSPPFSNQELADPKIHKVLSNYDLMGGPATFNVLYAPDKFHSANPKTYGALLVALDRAMAAIKADPTAAAALYIKSESSRLTPAFVEAIIRDPENDFTATPLQTLKTAQFLYKTGAVKVEASKWQDMFFPKSTIDPAVDGDRPNPPDGKPLLSVDAVTLQYRVPGRLVTAVHDVSFEVVSGDRFVILGPSGCGKSSLLKAIAGFGRPSAGAIKLGGVPIRQPGPDRMMVFQDLDQLLPWQTVAGNVVSALRRAAGLSRAEAEARAAEMIGRVGLAKFAEAYPHTLSGGMKQRAALARALALRPAMLLMDEPFAALDALTRATMQRELLSLSLDMDLTVLFVTHSVEEALLIGTRILVLSAHPGQVRAEFQGVAPDAPPPARERLKQRIETLVMAIDHPAAAVSHAG